MGDEQHGAAEGLQRGLERLAALEVEVVGGLVEDQDVRLEWTRIASASRRRSPPDSPASGFSASSPENRKRPSSARALPGVSPVARCAASSTVPVGSELVGVLGEVGELDVVAAAQLAVGRVAAAVRVSMQRGLAGAVRADQRDVLASLEPQVGAVEQRLLAGLDAPPSSSKTTRPLRFAGANAKSRSPPARGRLWSRRLRRSE